jgi:hypothetical protein
MREVETSALPRRRRWWQRLATTGKYFLGVLMWFLVLGWLRASCALDVYGWIEAIGVAPVKDGLVRNLLGTLALQGNDGCSRYLLYTVEYRAADVALSELVDVATWRLNRVEGNHVEFTDARHVYIVEGTADGPVFRASDK